jgi:DNA-binding CsgD family transcriptional regulator
MTSAKTIAAQLTQVEERAATLRKQRDKAILREVAQGRRPADLARETGLTRGRITQLTKETQR